MTSPTSNDLLKEFESISLDELENVLVLDNLFRKILMRMIEIEDMLNDKVEKSEEDK